MQRECLFNILIIGCGLARGEVDVFLLLLLLLPVPIIDLSYFIIVESRVVLISAAHADDIETLAICLFCSSSSLTTFPADSIRVFTEFTEKF